MLRCHALKSLAETGNPTAVGLLVRVVREPRAEGTETEKQNALDVRLAAARALSHFKEADAAATLYYVKRKEKDVSLRMCAYEAHKTSTCKKLHPDSKDWELTMHLEAVPAPVADKVAAVKPAGAVEKVAAVKPAGAAEPTSVIKPASATAPASTEAHSPDRVAPHSDAQQNRC